MIRPLGQRAAAEGIGTAFLLMAVVGSGIMAERLSGGNEALVLLANSVSTGAMLFVLVTAFAPLSGAHFNPAVTLVFALRGDIGRREAACYTLAQLAGAVAGVWLAHLMFGLPLLETAQKTRTGGGQWLAEAIATFGLVLAILATSRSRTSAVPSVVALYIVAAYWFTASTSFANPAVTLARTLSDSFAGIRPTDAPAFIAAQLAGAVAALLLCRWLLEPMTTNTRESETV